jgi:mono/diheme cytochrome c family protein
MRNHPFACICTVLATITFTLYVNSAGAQEKVIQIKTVAPSYTNPTSGSEMYAKYCAACHGMGGRGDGPAAPAFNSRPTNLTLLSRSHGGKYPRMLVVSTLQQSKHIEAHGNAQMPVWSDAFRRLDSMNPGTARLRINNLTNHIESLQVK